MYKYKVQYRFSMKYFKEENIKINIKFIIHRLLFAN